MLLLRNNIPDTIEAIHHEIHVYPATCARFVDDGQVDCIEYPTVIAKGGERYDCT